MEMRLFLQALLHIYVNAVKMRFEVVWLDNKKGCTIFNRAVL